MHAFEKFPLALFMHGWADLDACVVVHSDEEEAQARSQGYRPLSEPVQEIAEEPEKRKPGRPRKAE